LHILASGEPVGRARAFGDLHVGDALLHLRDAADTDAVKLHLHLQLRSNAEEHKIGAALRLDVAQCDASEVGVVGVVLEGVEAGVGVSVGGAEPDGVAGVADADVLIDDILE